MHGKVEELRALTSIEFLDSFTEDENKEEKKARSCYVYTRTGIRMICF
ncbi:hypothetical protein CsSME_00051676 [Camellia sinensis var. sinensis]